MKRLMLASLATLAVSATAALAQTTPPPGGAGMAMPTMPSGTTMPAMPGGTAMPAMPGAMTAPSGTPLMTMPGSAEQQGQMATMMVEAAQNQLGVLEYCQGRGAVGADVIALQKRVIGALPAPPSDAGLAQAEASGKEGKVAFAGKTVTLSDAAAQKNTTVDAMCKEMGSMLLAQASNLPK